MGHIHNSSGSLGLPFAQQPQFSLSRSIRNSWPQDVFQSGALTAQQQALLQQLQSLSFLPQQQACDANNEGGLDEPDVFSSSPMGYPFRWDG